MTGFETRTGVPAAWYPDPQGPPLLRWWDGSGWTPQTMDPRITTATVSVESEVARPVDHPVERPAERPAERIVEPEPPSYVPMAGFPSTPARRSTYVSIPQTTGSSQTAPIWFLALYPLISVVVTLVLGAIVGGMTGTVPQVAAGGASLVVTLILCSSDSRLLRERGYRPPGWGWGLIPIVYFILRLVRVGKDSLWPFLVWVGLQVVLYVIILMAVLLPLMASGAFGGPISQSERASQLTPGGMAERLGADLTEAGLDVTSAVCPPLPSTDAGAEVQCQVETPTSTMYVIVAVTPEEPGTAFVINGGRSVAK